jgi:hypothetical protein
VGIVARTIVAAVVVCALGLAGSTSASADTHLYRDALRPNGHARTTAQKFADFRACGYRKGTYVTDSEAARIDACMRSRGWTLDRVVESRPGMRSIRSFGQPLASGQARIRCTTTVTREASLRNQGGLSTKGG